MSSTPKRSLAGLTFILLILVSSAAFATPWDRDHKNHWAPSSFFVQTGSGDTDTYAYTVGATWNWRWHRQLSIGRVTGYTEVAVGRWQHEIATNNDSQWFTQIGATPVLRLYPEAGDGRWFTEVGIGANYIAPLYLTDRKHFSTKFNFGDHAAFGRILDNAGRSSVALRYQHFSNGGIDAPNPGENFTQLRFSHQY
ncbi:MAG: acyloxyacyl hydrolase [Pseudomonadota bacterium]